MGVRPYKSFTYDGESSLDYGVYLTGEGVFNAPERAVEMVEIPGRNGAYALDQGRFQNISVTYRAGMVDYSESDFATRISDVRNWLCSKVGYKRLEDDYNPNEYRMALYMSGIKVEHDDLQTGEFEITFDCKPQRYLTSGETAVTVTDGDTITNPTLFASSPLLAVEGYGTIKFNRSEIELENVTIGEVQIPVKSSGNLDLSFLNVGDSFTATNAYGGVQYQSKNYARVTSSDVTSTTNCSVVIELYSYLANVSIRFGSVDFVKGTPDTSTGTATFKITGDNMTDINATATSVLTYDGADGLSVTTTVSPSTDTNFNITPTSTFTHATVTGNSSKSALGHPTYIDCDIGEAYLINDDTPTSLNSYIDLGSDLPELSPGANEFEMDNTVTELKVTPRWWKV